MRVSFALFVSVCAASCASVPPAQHHETHAELPSLSYVSVSRLAARLELDYLGEAEGYIEMAAPPDHVVFTRDSRNALVNGKKLALGRPCLRRGTEFVVSASDADLVCTTLAGQRSGRDLTPLPGSVGSLPPERISPSGLPPEFRPASGARPRAWRWIVVHHAAMEEGSAERIHRVHLGNGWDGLGYHFVIGNGTLSGDGQIEMGFRWRDQLHGAHARARPGDDNRWNLHGIGICLVGDFTDHGPSRRQLDALVLLVRALMAEYDIAPSNVVPHSIVHDTACPGARFPWRDFMTRIR
jgi:hypothetical protein